MAILRFGATVVGVRGTIGGITYSSGSAGPYARLWSRGSNPRTALQSITRGRIASNGILWADLSDVEKAAWDAFGQNPPEIDTNSLGEVYKLRGWQWLVRVNQRRQSVGLAPTSTLPSDAAVTPAASCTITATAFPTGPFTIEWPENTIPAGHSGVAFLAVHPTAGLQNKTSGFVQIWAEHEPSGESVDITDAVAARFGVIPARWKLFARLYVLRDDGVRSTYAAATCIVEE